jgi:hypothetical protein
MRALPAIVVLAACAPGGFENLIPACMSDSQCGSGQVCFADGCGDPGGGLVVEVTGNPQQGFLPQDFAIADAGVSASMSFNVMGPLSIVGSVVQAVSTGVPAEYTAPITIRATGESALIPGQSRTYEATIQAPPHGFYQLPVGTGLFDVSATAATTPDYPPEFFDDVPVSLLDDGGYEAPAANFTFVDTNVAPYFNGKLIKTTLGGMPVVTIPVEAKMQVQAFDPATHRALSQRNDVATDGTINNVHLGSAAMGLASISVVASPRDPTALVPTKTFVLPTGSQAGVQLEMGDYGTALPGVRGSLADSTGEPIGGATVIIQGTVGGGGTFASRRVITDADGGFAVDLLASQGPSSMTLIAYPPTDSPAGILQVPVGVTLDPDAGLGLLSQGVFTCPERLVVTGELVKPDGRSPAVAATVTATPLEASPGFVLPAEPTSTATDAVGHYQLFLDPAVYRIDYLPVEALPQKSRIVRLSRSVDNDAGTVISNIDLGPFSLSAGRTVAGIVTAHSLADVGGVSKPAPNALVRFFRVTSVEGKPSALLLGQAICDDSGRYKVILPDHPQTAVALDLHPDAGAGLP